MNYFFLFLIGLLTFNSCRKIQTRNWPQSEFTVFGKTYKTKVGEQGYGAGSIPAGGNLRALDVGYEASDKSKGIRIELRPDRTYLCTPGTYEANWERITFPANFRGTIFYIEFTNNYNYSLESVSGYQFHVSNNDNGFPEAYADDMLFKIVKTNDPNIDTSIYLQIPFIIRTHKECPF